MTRVSQCPISLLSEHSLYRDSHQAFLPSKDTSTLNRSTFLTSFYEILYKELVIGEFIHISFNFIIRVTYMNRVKNSLDDSA
jgi:hypothetical protein